MRRARWLRDLQDDRTVGLLVGIAGAWLFLRERVSQRLTDSISEYSERLRELDREQAILQERASQIPGLQARVVSGDENLNVANTKLSEAREEVSKLGAQIEALIASREDMESRLRALSTEKQALDQELVRSASELATLRKALEAERVQSSDKLKMLEQARESLSDQFKSLANEILESKTEKFTEHNRAQVDQLLQPLRDQLKEFKEKVEDIHLKDREQQGALFAELGQIKQLNQRLTEEAHGLATALRGQKKAQGNWGELVLENVLDSSGLRLGHDYKREISFTTEDGRQRPDVIVYLPQGKHLIIDAKVSLNAYTRYINEEDQIERERALREHANAVASRIKELSDKSYFEIPGLNSPEVVFMFVPVESAFVEALKYDETLFQRAIEKNVLVATPTTLLTSLNIVRQLWRFEEQNAATAQLAERASKVYKKLNTFLQSMEGVGNALDRAQSTYRTAFSQLYSGKDNLIKQANEFRRLGVSVQSSLPANLVSKANLELEYLPDEIIEAVPGDAPAPLDPPRGG